MTRKGQITVTGTQWDEFGEAQTTQITAAAEYHAGSDGFYIFYEEADEDERTIKNMIKLKDGILELTKKGSVSTHMVFAPGQENSTSYATPFGALPLGVRTDTVERVLTERELQISATYSLCWQDPVPHGLLSRTPDTKAHPSQDNIISRCKILIKLQFEG